MVLSDVADLRRWRNWSCCSLNVCAANGRLPKTKRPDLRPNVRRQQRLDQLYLGFRRRNGRDRLRWSYHVGIVSAGTV
jgi:hypothetical protein